MTRELENILSEKGHNMSISTVLRKLGWTCRGSAYCQLIREANKAKRLEWAESTSMMISPMSFLRMSALFNLRHTEDVHAVELAILPNLNQGTYVYKYSQAIHVANNC